MSLKDYRQKRDFDKTKEPAGDTNTGSDGIAAPLFMIHKHHARRLHYDLRIEVDGVLKSWAVPKGPSMHPGDKRLAVMVEDHPYDYKDFEGIIPEGEYGAGTVMIWDKGNYAVQEGEPAEALERGSIKLVLNGSKLKGGFALVRTKMGGKEENWLLIKEKDKYADSETDILESAPDSVGTGRSMEEIADAQ